MRFKDKVVIVTGAGQSLEKSYAERLRSEGASVVVAEINEASGRSLANSTSALYVRMDVTNRASCESMAKVVLDRRARIDVLVNNAAIASDIVADTPFCKLRDEDRDKVMNLNARGTWLATFAVIPAMQQQHWGRIVNVA